MKCKLHPHEVADGVCATCLRERLLAIVTASPSSPDDQHLPDRSSVEHEQPSSHAHALPFPRSVSPYVSHCRSDASTIGGLPDAQTGKSGGARLADAGKSSALSPIYGQHRSDGSFRDPDEPTIRLSGSWLSTLIHGGRGRKKDKKKEVVDWLFSADNSSTEEAFFEESLPTTPGREDDRGMYPDRSSNAPQSGYVSDSGGLNRRRALSPIRRPKAEHQRHKGRGMAGFAVCFSPFSSPSFNRRKCHIGMVSTGGDLRPTQPVGHASGGRQSLRWNRSRKLANLGKKMP